MYTCKKATQLIEKEATENLSILTKIRLKMHLMMCKACAAYKKQSQLLSFWIKNKKASNVEQMGLSEDFKKEMIKKMKKKQMDM
ncbi:hypothetical protein [Aureispira sp. CCB-QB1]|uniref:anti-sigma factor family protein n=1 Tax=Aureispira sp. CCB-QB1 TaxID=1313421 RepID=UPI00069604FF|nr:hypothetical protein [Aureispira sp. CCB-QB1]